MEYSILFFKIMTFTQNIPKGGSPPRLTKFRIFLHVLFLIFCCFLVGFSSVFKTVHRIRVYVSKKLLVAV